MKPAPKIPYGGTSTAIFGLVLIAIFWVGTTQRSATELAEAVASEYSDKINTVLDSILRRRSDGSMVRVMTSVGNSEAESTAEAVKLSAHLAENLDEFVPE